MAIGDLDRAYCPFGGTAAPAVREQRTMVVEDERAIAQQGPALAGLLGDVAGGPPVGCVGGRAYRVVGAHDAVHSGCEERAGSLPPDARYHGLILSRAAGPPAGQRPGEPVAPFCK